MRARFRLKIIVAHPFFQNDAMDFGRARSHISVMRFRVRAYLERNPFPTRAIALLAAAGAVACATATPAQPSPADAKAVVERGDEPTNEAEDDRLRQESLERLSSAVETMSAGPEHDHGGLVEALRQLANVIELTPRADRTSVAMLRKAAQNLVPSDSLALAKTEVVTSALRAALRALFTRRSPERHKLEYQKSTRAFGASIEKIDAARSLLEQHANVAAALRAATDGVYLANGAEAPFGEAETSASDAVPALSLESAVQEAQTAVLTLGQMDWTQARGAASRALAALADVVAAADARNELGTRVSDIRFQAERIQYASSLSSGRAGWIKAGLSRALESLEPMQLGDEECMEKWTRAAREAIASIQERSSLAFQRAAVQDAFRSTIDAFVAVTPPTACR